ncbi:unnamed protein product [Urochloa humidicola]
MQTGAAAVGIIIRNRQGVPMLITAIQKYGLAVAVTISKPKTSGSPLAYPQIEKQESKGKITASNNSKPFCFLCETYLLCFDFIAQIERLVIS